jgi:cardiolipin synthase
MSATESSGPGPDRNTDVRELAEQALSRSSGAPFIAGNSVRILRDSTENYPAWLEAISRARRIVLFENYIVGHDAVGEAFIAALTAKAREGVPVRVIYDWLGTGWKRDLFQPIELAGGQVRCYNPPRLDSPLGWVTRDHRKMIAVDGEVAFVSGLCLAQRWRGDPRRGVAPWRDTGVEVRGPAVPEIERAFKRVWDASGAPIPEDELTPPDDVEKIGEVSVMVLASEPTRSGVYRLDQFIATIAHRTLWLADAYYVGIPAYVDALRRAAGDGVDVRLLVPGASDLPITQAFSRAGYRPLLEAGVRVFEWNGTMMHAKTAVADCRWSRVGSSNLNLSSFLANYELDLAVYDSEFGRRMEDMYLQDLDNATEIVLAARNRVRALRADRPLHLIPPRGSASRAAASALRIGNTVTAALANRRVLGASEAGLMAKLGAIFLFVAVAAWLWPLAVAIPALLFCGWIGLALLIRAWKLRRSSRSDAIAAEAEGHGTETPRAEQ